MPAKIQNYSNYSERQLKKMLDTTESREAKLKAEFLALKAKVKTIVEKRHLIQDAIMEKWREPSNELLEAIAEIERGEFIHCENFDEYLKAVNEED